MASVASAVLLAALFLIAGVWKITEPFDAASRMVQAKIPADLGLTAAIGFGIAETFSAVLLLIPRFRRWGAWLTGLLLVAFMLYIGYYYNVLRGAECSCFPWLKRAVGPGFFVFDGAMLVDGDCGGLVVAAFGRQTDGSHHSRRGYGVCVRLVWGDLRSANRSESARYDHRRWQAVLSAARQSTSSTSSTRVFTLLPGRENHGWL